MGKLDKAVGYLSGPMEFAKDYGVEWRKKFRQLAREARLKIDLIDPTDKPGGQDIKIGENQAYQQALQREGRWGELKEYVGRYRRYDLRFVDICDFLVVVVDPTIPQWGTSNETVLGEWQHKPNFFINANGLYDLPRWLFDIIEVPYHNLESNVFTSVEDVIQHLKDIDEDRFPMSREWVLVRKYLEELRKDWWWEED